MVRWRCEGLWIWALAVTASVVVFSEGKHDVHVDKHQTHSDAADFGDASSKPAEKSAKPLVNISIDSEGHAKIYKNLLKVKRREQMNAVKSILAMEDTRKQKFLLLDLISRMEKTLVGAKQFIEKANFAAGDPFPSGNEKLKEAVANVVENMAFFCELALRFPTVVTAGYVKNDAWRSIVHWAYSFSAAANLYDESGQKLLNLGGQQLQIIPREENFVNPYDRKYLKEQMELDAVRRMEEAREKKLLEKKLERKKKKSRGPSMSRTEL